MNSGPAVPAQPLDVVAWITVRVHANGALSVAGTIGDPRLARRMLDHARDAIVRQVPEDGIVVPNRDVDVVAPSALRELGDLPATDRGDP